MKDRPREDNRDGLRRLAEAGPPPGLLAFDGDTAVGWCELAPRADLEWLAHSRVTQPVDDLPVWSVPCFYVRRGYRGQGVMSVLIGAAIPVAESAGAPDLEAYPVDTAVLGHTRNLFPGVASAFTKHGFPAGGPAQAGSPSDAARPSPIISNGTPTAGLPAGRQAASWKTRPRVNRVPERMTETPCRAGADQPLLDWTSRSRVVCISPCSCGISVAVSRTGPGAVWRTAGTARRCDTCLGRFRLITTCSGKASVAVEVTVTHGAGRSIGILPAVNDGDSFCAVHAALGWVTASAPAAGACPGLTSAPQSF
jgi:GNAT superfamily N-acetyltransferase